MAVKCISKAVESGYEREGPHEENPGKDRRG